MKVYIFIVQALTVAQIKKLRVVIDEQITQNDTSLTVHETERNEALKEMGNFLHESCIVSNDEVFVYKCCFMIM